MWVYQKLLTLESVFLVPHPNSTQSSFISISRVFLPCSLELHKAPPSPTMVLQYPTSGSSNLGTGHSPSTASTPLLLLTKRLTQPESRRETGGRGGLEAGRQSSANGPKLAHSTGRISHPGATSAANSQSPENQNGQLPGPPSPSKC